MIIVVLSGGLGNQMFQIAAASELALSSGEKVVIDTFSYTFERARKPLLCDILKMNNIVYQSPCYLIVDYWIKRVFGTIVAKVRGGYFDNSKLVFHRLQFVTDSSGFPLVRNSQGLCVVSGYFQAPKYFGTNVFPLFEPLYVQESEVKELKEKMMSQKSVSIHIRRGDYVGLGLSLDIEYYNRAVEYLVNHLGNDLIFYLFSDDIDWCEKNLKTFQYIPVKIKSNHKDTDELFLMSSCRHNIIANSTYSWWGGYLNQHTDKIVIAPKKKFNNLEIIPDSWIRL